MPRRYIAEKQKPIPVPEMGEGAQVWGPGELDFWDETRIRSRSQRNEIDPVKGTSVTIMDSALFEYEIFHTWLEHDKAGWNFFDENDQPYDRTQQNIDKIFKGDDGKAARNRIIVELVKAFFPELMTTPGQTPVDESEGNGRTTDSAHGSGSVEGPAPILPANGQMSSRELTETPGSTPTPLEEPSPVPS